MPVRVRARSSGRALPVGTPVIFETPKSRSFTQRRATRALGEEDVLRLDVAVNDLLLVRGDEPREHLDEDVDDVLERQPGLGRDAVGQGLAEEPLHDDVGAPVVERAEIDHAADVGVPDCAGGTGLLMEATDRVFLCGLARVEHLDGDRAAQGDVLRLEDRAHASLAQDAAHAVPASDGPAEKMARDGPPRRRGRRRWRT